MRKLKGEELKDAMFWLKMANSIAFGHSRCRRDKRGAVVVDQDQRLIGSGFNGLPRYRACFDAACKPTCRYTAIHAEQMALDGARSWNPDRLENALVYHAHVDMETGEILDSRTPKEKACEICAPLMVKAGVAGLVLKVKGGFIFCSTDEYSIHAERQRLKREASMP